jgi:hypothetical protein
MRPTRWNLVFAGLGGLSLTACTTAPPPIARGLPANIQEARRAFAERVPARFPVGSSESDLRAELHREHFAIRAADPRQAPYQFTALVDHPGVCRLRWGISWSAADDRITAIGGSYSADCL